MFTDVTVSLDPQILKMVREYFGTCFYRELILYRAPLFGYYHLPCILNAKTLGIRISTCESCEGMYEIIHFTLRTKKKDVPITNNIDNNS